MVECREYFLREGASWIEFMRQPVTVTCPKCGAENSVPLVFELGGEYRCRNCKIGFPNVYKTYWGEVVISILAWGLALGLSALARDAVPNDLGFIVWYGPTVLFTFLLLTAAPVVNFAFVLRAREVKKFTGTEPRGYKALVAVLVVMLGIVVICLYTGVFIVDL